MKTTFKNNIHIFWDYEFKEKPDTDLLLKSIFLTKKFEKISNKFLIKVFLVGDLEIKELNHKFLGNNHETDVLSFNYYDGWENGKISNSVELFPGEDNIDELGELYLSVPQISKQAKENNITFVKELSRMAVHGTLHLLGYNHEEINEEKIMFSKTDKILSLMNLD
jgi:probable rRNA maturation factor|tara:strand:+ start:4140 stop:4637 length:498 start_codon:yes stop_codon:yes gene_type:complete